MNKDEAAQYTEHLAYKRCIDCGDLFDEDKDVKAEGGLCGYCSQPYEAKPQFRPQEEAKR